MTSAGSDTATSPDLVMCGCCGRQRPAGRVHALGATPGVHICRICALWSAARMTGIPVEQLDPRRVLGRLRAVARREHDHAEAVYSVTPVLHSTDLTRTCDYYRALGFALVERHDTYLVMHADGAELHFLAPDGDAVPGSAFLHVADADALRRRLSEAGTGGLGPIVDQPYGLREFVATDPDRNRIRLGSHLHDD